MTAMKTQSNNSQDRATEMGMVDALRCVTETGWPEFVCMVRNVVELQEPLLVTAGPGCKVL
jgi:hypothetical protein